MNVNINPFFEVYAGDRMTSTEFATIFSPFLVEHASALFLPGNVVVKGIQGSGKSMLLTLLKPEVRLEYARANANFPVRTSKGEAASFIGAGVNLAHCNAMDFGYRAASNDAEETALLFADFVNYQIVRDLLRSVRVLAEKAQSNAAPQIDLSPDREHELIKTMSGSLAFQGALSGCQSFSELDERIDSRINSYVRYLHRNDKVLSEDIRSSKTDMGTPISKTVEALKASCVIGADVPVFVHIDQYEELANISSNGGQLPDYRSVVNRALARRDPAVSYRIGTRGHAWRNHGRILGTNAQLEEERDYKFVDLDLLLRRGENRRTWIFPSFVEDVFARRLQHAGLAPPEAGGSALLDTIFGPGITPADKARRYGGRNPQRAVKTESEWPKPFSSYLEELAGTDPLEARLLEARARQLTEKTQRSDRRLLPDQLSKDIQEDIERDWWRKERVDLALVQIAGRCQERPIWAGRKEIVDISGGNILTFLNICQNVWDTQMQLGERLGNDELKRIDPDLQAIGIFKASDYWLKKISRETGRSGDRSRFVKNLGVTISRRLHADRQMSNPGHNGFSIADEELGASEADYVRELLEEMVDYGTLTSSAHTTKERDRRERTKFYLNPVLCPHFKVPYKRLKEPVYLRLRDLQRWMLDANLPLPNEQLVQKLTLKSPSLPLFER